MIFLLTVALTSSFITIQNSRPTQAESLLNSLTCVVKGILSYDCPSNDKPKETTQEPQNSPPTSETGPSGNTSPSNDQTANTPQTIEMDEELLTGFPTIPEVKPVLLVSAADNFVLPNARGVSSVSTGVLGVSDSAALTATSEGWNIVGIPWYWWMLGMGGVAGLYVAVRSLITKSTIGIVK
jgi:hypothetical protein